MGWNSEVVRLLLMGLAAGFSITSLTSMLILFQSNSEYFKHFDKLSATNDHGLRDKRSPYIVPETTDDSASESVESNIRYGGRIDIVSNIDFGDIVAENGEMFENTSDDGTAAANSKTSILVNVLMASSHVDQYLETYRRMSEPRRSRYQLMYSESESDQSQLISDVKLTYLGAMPAFSQRHIVRSVEHVCAYEQENADWFVWSRDTVYVNRGGLEAVIGHLAPSDPIVIGKPSMAAGQSCSALLGIIFSRESLSRLCPNIRACRGYQSDHTTDPSVSAVECIERISGLTCIKSLRLLPNMHTTFISEATSTSTTFVGPLPDFTSSFIEAHIHFLELQIHRTQNNLLKMLKPRSTPSENVSNEKSSSTDPRSKRESVQQQDQRHKPYLCEFLNSTKEVFHEFIDSQGFLYSQNCRIRRSDRLRNDADYREMWDMALSTIRAGLKHNSFIDISSSFSLFKHRPNKAMTMDFFFLERPDDTDARRLHQVTMERTYTAPRVAHKTSSPLSHLNIITTIPDVITDNSSFMIDSSQHLCSQLTDATGVKCTIWLISSQSYAGTVRTDQIDVEINVLGASDFSVLLNTFNSRIPLESLMLFLPHQAEIDLDFLLRCQANARLKKRVYFPIPLYKYALRASSKEIPLRLDNHSHNEHYSFWGNRHFETMCVHNLDVQDFGAHIKEVSDLYSLLMWSGLDVVRAPDPGLVLHSDNPCQNLVNYSDKHDCMEEMRSVNFQ